VGGFAKIKAGCWHRVTLERSEALATFSQTRVAPGALAAMVLATSSVLCSSSAAAEGGTVAELKLRDGNPAGRVEVIAAPGGAFLRVKVMGLPPGGHAVKVHETGKCEGDFASAGAILNPLGAGFGLLNDEGPAAGDLPNIYAGPNGEGEAEFITALLQPGAAEGDTLLDEDQSAIVIYDKPDDHLGVPDASFGDRIACGVIGKAP
jgi:superoxide dismutase, Cu-Zn family